MRSVQTSLSLLCLLALGACASSEPLEDPVETDIDLIRRAAGCEPDQIAVCVAVSCEPTDYVCTERRDFRRVFEARPHN